MDLNIFGSRLRSARLIAGLTLEELSERINKEVTKQALSKYENGLMQPSSLVLNHLSDALDLKVDFFLKDTLIKFKAIEYRKSRHLSKKDEEVILESARVYYENYSEIETILGISTSFSNPLKNDLIDNEIDVENAAGKLREYWKLGVQPISNLIEMLENVGIKIYTIDHGDSIDGIAIEVDGGAPLVIINTADKPLERIRFTIIHELAHILLNFTNRVKSNIKLMEKLCHYFASCFIIPKSSLLKLIGGKKRNYIKIEELIRIKEYYGISIRALVYRLKQIGIISENYYKRWTIWLNNTFTRKGEPGNYLGREESSNFMQLIDRALSEGLISLSKAASLTNLSINQLKAQPFG